MAPKLAIDMTPGPPGEWKMTAEGLPVISDDGKVVALLFQKEDGLRGYPNHAIVLRGVDNDKSDKEVFVLIADEIYIAESAPNASGTTLLALRKKADQRLALARGLLTKSSWQRLRWQLATGAPGGADAGVAPIKVAGIEVALAGGRLRATDASGQPLLEEDATKWAVKPHKAGLAGDVTCTFEPYVAEVAADPDRGALVVRIAQATIGGGDSCNEPSAYHVFRLKR